MNQTVNTFAVYEFYTLEIVQTPMVHYGYALVYNPIYALDGSLKAGYIKLDIKTLLNDYNTNRYISVAEIEDEVTYCMGKSVTELFATQYINGWYYLDEIRTGLTFSTIEFNRFYYDMPHTIAFFHRLRKPNIAFSYVVFDNKGVSREEFVNINRVKSLYMGRYIKSDETHNISLREYTFTDTSIELGKVHSYYFSHDKLYKCVDESNELSRLVFSTNGVGMNELLFTETDAHAIINCCEYKLAPDVKG